MLIVAPMVTERDDNTRSDLLRIGEGDEIDRDMVGRVAGDIPSTLEQQAEVDRLRTQRGNEFYSDLLFVLCHTHYEPDHARQLWDGLIEHREYLNEMLGRNAGAAVAAVDYLGNLKGHIQHPTIIDSPALEAVAKLATNDAMTGLRDHSTFQLTLRGALTDAAKANTPVSVIMLDVDHFKRFNDRYGHPAGDRLLKRLGRVVKRTVRSSDTACRYGGEEFAVVCPGSTRDEAGALAERLRQGLAKALDPVTVSLGVATSPDHARGAGALVKAADQALYRSKENGRNRTTVARRGPDER